MLSSEWSGSFLAGSTRQSASLIPPRGRRASSTEWGLQKVIEEGYYQVQRSCRSYASPLLTLNLTPPAGSASMTLTDRQIPLNGPSAKTKSAKTT